MSENGDRDLDGLHVLLGVSGGIAAYKSPDVVRRLRERGAQVQVVMTAGARHFITPLSLQAVSGQAVRTDLWDEAAEAAMGHIELARWADLVLVAPASADLIARLACGLADDLLSTLCLATEAPLVLAPAMNRVMWAQQATRDNVDRLASRGVDFLGPAEGDQACGEVGPGRMVEPEALVAELVERTRSRRILAGLRIMITAGPTREALDPVRFLSNRSSGKMGYAVARAAVEAGARVLLVSGPVAIAAPAGVERVEVESARDMYEAVHRRIAGIDIFIGAAAISDYQVSAPAPQKVKKRKEPLSLALEPAPDVLASVARLPARPFTVGFAAETEHLERHAREKLERKSLDMIAANLVGEALAFERDENALTVIWPGGKETLASAPKLVLARQLVALIAERYRERRAAA